MGMYKYLTQAWNDREKKDLEQHMRYLAIKWRREPTVHRINYPTRLDRARALGYKAKQGYAVVRVRVRKGGARKPAAIWTETESSWCNEIYSRNRIEACC